MFLHVCVFNAFVSLCALSSSQLIIKLCQECNFPMCREPFNPFSKRKIPETTSSRRMEDGVCFLFRQMHAYLIDRSTWIHVSSTGKLTEVEHLSLHLLSLALMEMQMLVAESLYSAWWWSWLARKAVHARMKTTLEISICLWIGKIRIWFVLCPLLWLVNYQSDSLLCFWIQSCSSVGIVFTSATVLQPWISNRHTVGCCYQQSSQAEAGFSLWPRYCLFYQLPSAGNQTMTFRTTSGRCNNISMLLILE